MKKIKILSIASLPLAMALLAGCGDEPGPEPGPGPDPQPEIDHTVNAEEWFAAFNAEKVFGFADNFKLSMNVQAGESLSAEEFIIDGLKMKYTSANGVLYYTNEGDEFYKIYSLNDAWVKAKNNRNPSQMYKQYLEPFGPNFESFTYSEESQSYKCTTFDYGGGTIENLEVKFDAKHIVFATLQAQMGPGTPMVFDATISYGEQVVEVPEAEPLHEHAYTIQGKDEFLHWMECECGVVDMMSREPHIDVEDEDGFCDVCGYEMGTSPIPVEAAYAYNVNGDGYYTMNHDDKNNQWEINDVVLHKDDTISFADIGESVTEPRVLETLYSENEQGFTFNNGVLTAPKDGTFAFIISPEGEKDRITIIDQSVPETNVKLMGSFDGWTSGLPMLLKDGSDTEYVIENVLVPANATFKVKEGDDDTGYCGTWKKDGENNAFNSQLLVEEDGNAKALVDLVVNVYYESALEGGQGFGTFVELKSVANSYKAIGTYMSSSQPISFTFDKVENGYAQYLVNIPEGYVSSAFVYSINKGDSVLDIEVEEKDEGLNFAEQADHTFKYNGEATTLNLYLKVYLDGSKLGLYAENASIIVDDRIPKTVTLKEDQLWAFNDSNIKIFAWVWGIGNEGSWIDVEYDVGSSSTTVLVPAGTTGLLLVRCPGATETPNWEITSGDEPGRIYNKTKDVTIGTPDSYELDFVDYPAA